MNTSITRRIPQLLIAACCLVAAADFLTTWWALSTNPFAEETGIIASQVLHLGGFPALLVADLIYVGILSALAYAVYSRYRSNLAPLLLLGPYICVGIYSSISNGMIAL
jgi:hypothetical protein